MKVIKYCTQPVDLLDVEQTFESEQDLEYALFFLNNLVFERYLVFFPASLNRI